MGSNGKCLGWNGLGWAWLAYDGGVHSFLSVTDAGVRTCYVLSLCLISPGRDSVRYLCYGQGRKGLVIVKRISLFSLRVSVFPLFL